MSTTPPTRTSPPTGATDPGATGTPDPASGAPGTTGASGTTRTTSTGTTGARNTTGTAGAPQAAREQAGEVAGEAKDQARQVAGEAKDQARNLAHETKGRVREQVGGQRDRAVGALRDLGDELEQMASRSDRSGPGAELARRAAHQTRALSQRIDGREPGDLLEDVRDYARRRPGAFLLGAAAVGVVVGRLTRGAVAARSEASSGSSGWSGAGTGNGSGNGRSYGTGTRGSSSVTPAETAQGYPGQATGYTEGTGYPAGTGYAEGGSATGPGGAGVPGTVTDPTLGAAQPQPATTILPPEGYPEDSR